MTDIMDRITLLSELKMINEADKKDLLVIIATIEERLSIKITEENGGILVTHTAAMFQRNRSGEDIGALDKGITDELASHVHFEEAVELVKEISNAIVNTVSSREEQYLLLHLCTLISGI